MRIEITTPKKFIYSLGGEKQHAVLTGQRRGEWILLINFVNFHNISLGATLDWWAPNFEIHLPFFFLKFGRSVISEYSQVQEVDEV